MKKIIALALALVLALSLGSVALAACPLPAGHWVPGQKVTITVGADFTLDSGAFDEDYKDYKVTTDFTKGAALVDSVKFNKDTNVWELKLKENYTITDAKDLVGKITFTNKADRTDFAVVSIAKVVTNHVEEVYGEKKVDDATVIPAANDTVYQCSEDDPGYVKFNANALLGVTLNMAAKEKAFMYQVENDADLMDELEEKYPDAEIETYTFGGQPTFKNAAEITLQADYADQYFIYAYEGKKLTAVDAKWNSTEGVYEWSTKSPKTYVISDVELVAAAEEEAETKNPDTGANDVVGVAAALAVVSLVAAGAVALKK